MQYSQKVKRIYYLNNDSSKAITRVVVETTLQDSDGVSASLTRDMPLYPPDENTFVPYEDLTEDLVLSWCPIDSDLELSLLNELERVRSVDVFRNFPWES
jgi:hypothetical protein